MIQLDLHIFFDWAVQPPSREYIDNKHMGVS